MARERPEVLDEIQALLCEELPDTLGEPLRGDPRQEEAVKAAAAGVRVVPAGAGQIDGHASGLQENAHLLRSGGGAVLDHEGHRPELARRLRILVREVAGLGDLQLQPVALHPRGDRHQRMTGLLDPCVGDPGHVLTRRLVEGAPEIVRRRVRLGVSAEVDPDAFAERVLAKVSLDHPEDRRAFRVGDRVEPLRRFLRALGLDRDRVRRREGVQVECARVIRDEIAPVAPLGVERGRRLLADERRERLVEPEIGPPAHRDQVAPPHVRELMRGGREHTLHRGDRRVATVGGEQPRSVRDRAGILHRARFEVGDADRVDLVIGVGDGRVTLEPLHRAHMRIARVDALLRETGREAHPDRDPRGGRRRRGELVRADGERDEVARDLRGLAETRDRPVLAKLFLALDRHIRDRRVPRRMNEL